MGWEAGRKEELMSQADRIPAHGAHLSGQEPGAAASGPAPRKRLRLPRSPVPRPDPERRGRGGATPLSPIRRRQRRLPSPPQAPDSGAGLPRAGGGLLAPFSDCRPLSSRL